MSNKHPHAEIIHAYADGAQIQYRTNNTDSWKDIKTPSFCSSFQYRVKPSDIVTFAVITLHGMSYWNNNPDVLTNVKLTYDGETKKLKAVELITK